MTPQDELKVLALLEKAGAPGRTILDGVTGLVDDYLRLHEMVQRQSRRTPYERLLEQLDEDRNDVLGMLADAALDEGKEEEAKAWYWLARNRRWPFKDRQVIWFWAHSALEPCPDVAMGHILPRPLWLVMSDTTCTAFTSAREALEAVVETIASGKWRPSSEPKEAPVTKAPF